MNEPTINNYQEDYVYSDNEGKAEIAWQKYIQQEIDSHTHIEVKSDYCNRCQGKCQEVRKNG